MPFLSYCVPPTFSGSGPEGIFRDPGLTKILCGIQDLQTGFHSYNFGKGYKSSLPVGWELGKLFVSTVFLVANANHRCLLINWCLL